MKYKHLLVVMGCLFIASQAQGGREEIAISDLPPIVESRIKEEPTEVKIVYVRKETEDGKMCYFVMIEKAGQIQTIYVSPDGAVIVYMGGPVTLKTIIDSMIAVSLFAVLAGTIVGLVLRWTVQTKRKNRLSVLAGWLLSWFGAFAILCVILLSITTVPRDKDIVMVAITSVVCGAISASLVEIISLTVQAVLGYRYNYWRRVIGLCGVGLTFLSVSIPVGIIDIERQNQRLRAIALRPLPPENH